MFLYDLQQQRSFSPPPRSSSSLISHSDKENVVTRHSVHFQDHAKKITYHEASSSPRHASPLQEHEPNLSLQPSKSNLKRLETRRPSPISIPPADSHSTTSTPHMLPPNTSNWIRKNPPTTPPDYRRRSDGLIEPKTPQGFVRPQNPRLPDHSVSQDQSRKELNAQHQPRNDSRNYSHSSPRTNFTDDHRSRQYSQSPSNHYRRSSTDSRNNTIPSQSLDTFVRMIHPPAHSQHDPRNFVRPYDPSRNLTPSTDRRYHPNFNQYRNRSVSRDRYNRNRSISREPYIRYDRYSRPRSPFPQYNRPRNDSYSNRQSSSSYQQNRYQSRSPSVHRYDSRPTHRSSSDYNRNRTPSQDRQSYSRNNDNRNRRYVAMLTNFLVPSSIFAQTFDARNHVQSSKFK